MNLEHRLSAILELDLHEYERNVSRALSITRGASDSINRHWERAGRSLARHTAPPEPASRVPRWQEEPPAPPLDRGPSAFEDWSGGGVSVSETGLDPQQRAEAIVQSHEAAQAAISRTAQASARGISSAMNQLLWESSSAQQALESVGKSVTGQLLGNLSQFVAGLLAANLTKNTVGATQLASRSGQLAAETYAAAFAATAAIPLVGPALAPGVAASAVATMSAGLGPAAAAGMAAGSAAGSSTLASFDKGGLIPGNPGQPTPILAHGGEVVLNRKQQQNLLLHLMDGSEPPARRNPAAPPTSGAAHFHFHGPVIGDRRALTALLGEALAELSRKGGRAADPLRASLQRSFPKGEYDG